MFRGERFAEVWLKPEGQPFALTFRIPRQSFQLPGVGERLTVANLLKAVGVAPEEVDSWRGEGEQQPITNEANSELGRPLSPPAPDATHLILHVSLKQPPPAGRPGGGGQEIREETWQFLEERWQLILGLEASLDHLRMSMEGLRSEMDGATRKSLPLDVKAHAVSVDVVQWDKAKNRIRFAVPKMNEFIHRAVWATGAPEKKKLAELFETHVQARIPFPEIDDVMAQVDGLLKDRQTLFAQGTTVYQECKRLSTECQGALRTLESNANSRRKKK
jgi:hypothetical protein